MAKPMTLSGVWRRFLNLVSFPKPRKKLSKGKYFFGLVFSSYFFEKRDVIVMMTLASYLASHGLQQF